MFKTDIFGRIISPICATHYYIYYWHKVCRWFADDILEIIYLEIYRNHLDWEIFSNI